MTLPSDPESLLMSSYTKLSHPPIREAVLDIQVSPSSKTSIESFEEARNRLRDAYPYLRVQRSVGFKAEGVADSEMHQSVSMKVEGYQFFRADEKRMANFKLSGFSYHILKDYSDWNDLCNNTIENWRIYVEVAQPLGIIRIGTRFINDLEIQNAHIGEHFAFQLKLSELLSSFEFGNFAGILTVKRGEYEARIRLVWEPKNDEHNVTLDIDAFKSFDQTIDPDPDGLKDILQDLRQMKNDLFFEMLTKEGLNPYR